MFRIIKDVFRQWRIYPKAVGVSYVFRVLAEMCNALNIVFVKFIVDKIQAGNVNDRMFYGLVTLFITVSLIDQVFTKVSAAYRLIFKEAFFSQNFAVGFSKVFNLDYQKYIDEGSGKLLKKVNSGIEAQWGIFEHIFKLSSIAVIRFSVSLFLIFMTLPVAAGFLVLGIVLLLFIARRCQKKSDPLYERQKDIREDASRQETKMVMEKQLITLSNKQDDEIQSYQSILAPLRRFTRRADYWSSMTFDLMFVLFRLIEGVGYLFIGRSIVSHASSYGDLILLIGSIWQLRWPFEIIANALADRSKEKAKYESYHELMNYHNTVIDGNHDLHIHDGTIVYDNVGFGYSIDREIIKAFSLTIPGGTTCAFVGHSGSGKSTLIKLLLRYYNTDSGSILIDGQDISSLRVQSLYDSVGYLSQEPSTFDGTIRENLLYSVDRDSAINDDMLWHALENAHIAPRIKELPHGLDTQIGEKGIKLSGGERQRLAIARIFLKNPRILILDEPTSALDSVAEHTITHVMKKLFAGRTVIIIAHRLQTVMHADTIVVMESGAIVQQGKHDDLLTQDGVYKMLVNLQSGVVEE